VSEFSPLTPEQQSQLDQLNHQQALAAWQARETERLAEVAKFAPLDGTVDLQALTEALEAVDGATTDLDTRNRISRLRTILAFDLAALLSRLAQLQVAEPQPVTLEPEA
jgi:GAF domain-containing protein